jgi:hypothetical protein
MAVAGSGSRETMQGRIAADVMQVSWYLSFGRCWVAIAAHSHGIARSTASSTGHDVGSTTAGTIACHCCMAHQHTLVREVRPVCTSPASTSMPPMSASVRPHSPFLQAEEQQTRQCQWSQCGWQLQWPLLAGKLPRRCMRCCCMTAWTIGDDI